MLNWRERLGGDFLFRVFTEIEWVESTVSPAPPSNRTLSGTTTAARPLIFSSAEELPGHPSFVIDSGSRKTLTSRHLQHGCLEISSKGRKWRLRAAVKSRLHALLGRTGTADVIDAALVLLAVDGDVILTSDAADLAHLAAAAQLHVDVLPV